MKISASRLNLYCDCSLKYKFRYVDQIDKFSPSIHLAYGTAIHAALEKFNLLNDIKEEDILQEFHNIFNDEITKNEIRTNLYSDKLYLMGINALLKYCDSFLKNGKPTYEVIATEKEFEINYENLVINGIIDAVIKVGNDLLVIDYKTSKEAYNKFKIDTSIQLHLYSYAFRELLSRRQFNTKKTKENYVAYYVLVKDYENLDGDIQIQRKKIDNYDRLHYILKTFAKGVENEIFLPNYDSINCQYCEYKKECLKFKL